MVETELKVTQALEKTFTIAIFPYTDSWCLVPFSSNVSWDCKHTSVSCFECGSSGIIYRQGMKYRSGIHSKKILIKLAAHKYNSCNSDA
jgi:hypothetical protein